MDSKQKLQRLQKLEEITNGGDIAVARFLFQLEDNLDTAVSSLQEYINNLNDKTSQELIQALENNKLTDERLVEIITPLIPQVKDGLTPSTKELLAIIKPLIPKVENGKTPSKEELLNLIKPLIPQIDESDIVARCVAIVEESITLPSVDDVVTQSTEKTLEQVSLNIPKLGEPIRDSLELLEGKNRLDKSAIRGLDNYDEIVDLAKQERTLIKKYYGAGATAFTSLVDTPNSYEGKAGYNLQVNTAETGLEFSLSATQLAIGDSIIGGTPNRVLYQDASNNLAESDSFQYDEDNKLLTVNGGINIKSGGAILFEGVTTLIKDPSGNIRLGSNDVTGSDNLVAGDSNVVDGNNAVVYGNDNNLTGGDTFVFGSNNTTSPSSLHGSITGNTIIGSDNISTTPDINIFGIGNVSTGTAKGFLVGNNNYAGFTASFSTDTVSVFGDNLTIFDKGIMLGAKTGSTGINNTITMLDRKFATNVDLSSWSHELNGNTIIEDIDNTGANVLVDGDMIADTWTYNASVWQKSFGKYIKYADGEDTLTSPSADLVVGQRYLIRLFIPFLTAGAFAVEISGETYPAQYSSSWIKKAGNYYFTFTATSNTNAVIKCTDEARGQVYDLLIYPLTDGELTTLGNIFVGGIDGYENIKLSADGSASFADGDATIDVDGNIAGNNLSGTNTGDQDISGIATNASDIDDIETKTDFISVTQAVDLDTMESNIATNNAKVTNATHTGEVTGSGALTLDKTAISNQTDVPIVATDILLIGDTSDSNNLKKGAVQDIVDLVPTYWDRTGTTLTPKTSGDDIDEIGDFDMAGTLTNIIPETSENGFKQTVTYSDITDDEYVESELLKNEMVLNGFDNGDAIFTNFNNVVRVLGKSTGDYTYRENNLINNEYTGPYVYMDADDADDLYITTNLILNRLSRSNAWADVNSSSAGISDYGIQNNIGNAYNVKGGSFDYMGVGLRNFVDLSKIQDISASSFSATGYALYNLVKNSPSSNSVVYALYNKITNEGDEAWLIYNDGTFGDNFLGGDDIKTFFGTGKDASIRYDGTNMVIDPKEVGSGILDVQGTIQTDGYKSSDGSAGVTTTFTNGDGDTVTVKNGLITNIS